MQYEELNIIRLKNPDSILGKMLCLARMALELMILLIRKPSKRSARFARLTLQVTPHTMVSTTRLINLYDLVQKANALNFPGDIVECGVWNGGSSAIMGVACQDDKTHFRERNLWLFDSFQGLPQPGERDGKAERDYYFEEWCKGDIRKVTKILDNLEVSLENVKIIAGWFDSTLSSIDINTQIAVLHIDADWYDSVKVVLEKLYDKVVQGGFIVLDDYYKWEGCKKAADQYLKEHKIGGIVLKQVNKRGAAYFQKPIQSR